MNVLQVGISVFIFIETLNVLMLYFMPGSKKGNGVGIFNTYEDRKKDLFTRYLVNWVAGTKLIFIMVGLVVVLFGNYQTQLFTVVALFISILSFYWRLFPIIRIMDSRNEISPKGYSKTLNFMILFFLVGFGVVFLIGIN